MSLVTGLIIALVCVSVCFVALWFTLGIKWLLIFRDYKSKKDYLREIAGNLDKYLYRMDKVITLNNDIVQYLINKDSSNG